MLSNYFKLTLRTLVKNKLYTAINVSGLAVGVTACLLLFRLISYELSFDRFQPNFDRIVQVVTHDFNPRSGEDYTPGVPVPAMDEMQARVSQFEYFARTHSCWPTITVPDAPGSKIGKKIATEEKKEVGVFVEPDFFKIFAWTWLAGDASVLKEPHTVVFNRDMAERCFGDWRTAVGKTVIMDGLITLTVKGVVENAPVNTDFPLHVMVSYETVKKESEFYNYNPEWGSTSSNDQVFALLRGNDQHSAANTLLAEVGQHFYNRGQVEGRRRRHLVAPLADLHYDVRYSGKLGLHTTSKGRLTVLSLIGLLVLAMACFNFINLATAQAASRSREVGVRKSLGSTKGQLVRQFLGETALIVVFAVALGAFLAAILAPQLKHISEVPDHLPFLGNPLIWLFLTVVALAVSLLSGLYPAFVLSGFQPVVALKSTANRQKVGGVSLRKALVVAQFVIAQALIIGTIVTASQMDYLRKLDLGYTPDLIYSVPMSNDSVSLTRFDRYKAELLSVPGVESVSISSDVPSSGSNWASNFALGPGNDEPFGIFLKIGDEDYFKTYGLRLIAGRGLSRSDTIKEFVVNQYVLKKLGITNPEEALTMEFRLGGNRFMPIVGVVEDFKANSAKEEMKPMCLFSKKDYYQMAGIKIRPDKMQQTVADIQRVFDNTFPEQVFDGEYLDESIAEFYEEEAAFSNMCKGFALLAVLISCLGLYGLASLMAVQRTKEVGIRKALGASTAGIVGLMSRDFLKLVLLASLIAGPAAWYVMHGWLQDFVYRTPLSWWIFAVTILTACSLAVVTVGLRTWKTAASNPVQALRQE